MMKCHCKKKILFILKKRSGYGWCSYTGHGKYEVDDKRSNGLSNSAQFVCDMLNAEGFESKLIEVVDNNCIDREVKAFKPDIVIIEAFWVVPEKFDILHKLHPKVKWVIRNHSNWPFASTEGSLVDWMFSYLSHDNVFVSCNKQETSDSFRKLVKIANPDYTKKYIEYITPYLPNYYPITTKKINKSEEFPEDEVHIGNFGAIRPLKNSLIQAMAAIVYAEQEGKKLFYHINSFRVEGQADPIMKSIRMLFKHFPEATLVEENWVNHDDFLTLCANMDIVMQVAFDETFNIVMADAVNANTMVVGSKEIPWLSKHSTVEDITDVDSIVEQLEHVVKYHWMDKIFKYNKTKLKDYVERSRDLWVEFVKI
jgi:hypothetical protein